MGRSESLMDKPVYESLQAVSDLVENAGRLDPCSVIIPGGSRIDDLLLVEAARDRGIIDRAWLVGEPARIRAAAEEAEVTIEDEDIIAARSEASIASATVEHIAAGDADVILKGNISTGVLNKKMLAVAERSTVNLVSIFDAASIAQGRPMLLTDAGFTTVCSYERLVDMIRNAIDVAHLVMGLERPRVAVLSANEKQISSLPSTQIGLELAQRDWTDAVVCGPLSFDLATSGDSVSIKGIPNLPGAEEVAGQADILVCPGIDAANILYKAITALTKYGQASLAGVTVGFPVPYVILSRADTLETRLNSVALSCVYAQQRKSLQQDAGKPSPSSHVKTLTPPDMNGENPTVNDPTLKQCWTVIAQVADRVGALTSVVSAFSNRSLALDTVLAHGPLSPEEIHGRVVVSFKANEEEKETMMRILKRLSKVMHVACKSGECDRGRQALGFVMGNYEN